MSEQPASSGRRRAAPRSKPAPKSAAWTQSTAGQLHTYAAGLRHDVGYLPGSLPSAPAAPLDPGGLPIPPAGARLLPPTAAPSTAAQEQVALRLGGSTLAASVQPQRHAVFVLGRPVVVLLMY